MACDVTVKFFDQNIGTLKKVLDLIVKAKDGSNKEVEPLVALATAIKNNDSFRDKLVEVLSNLESNKTSSIDISNKKYLKPNIAYIDLPLILPMAEGWPDMTGVENFDTEKLSILYAEAYIVGGKTQTGLVRDTFLGKDIYIINKGNANRFRNYLILLKWINDAKEFDSDIKDVCKLINDALLAKKKEELSIKEILIKFIRNEEIVSNFPTKITVGKGGNKKEYVTRKYLEEYLLEQALERKKKLIYDTDLCNELRSSLIWKPTLKIYTTSVTEIKKILSHYIEGSEYKSLTKKQQNQLDTIIQNLKGFKDLEIKQKVEVIDSFFSFIYEIDPEFTFKRISIINGNTILLKNVATTLDERYGFIMPLTENTIRFYADYLGYKLYEFQKSEDSPKKYLYTLGIVTKKTQSKLCANVFEVKRRVEEKNNTDPLCKTNMCLKQLDPSSTIAVANVGELYFIPGQIIKTLAIDQIPKVLLSKEEADIYYAKENGRSLLFRYLNNIINNSKYIRLVNGKYEGIIPEVLDTTEKAATFLYLINTPDRKQKKDPNNPLFFSMIDEVLQILKNTENYRYYFVDSVSENGRIARVIQTDDTLDGLKEETNRPLPVITILKALTTAINNKLLGTNIKAELLTQDELTNRLMTEAKLSKDAAENIAKNKAFLFGNTIYINQSVASISDPLHEYAHVFLGILKAKNYETYKNLMETVLSEKRNRKKINKLLPELKTKYPNLSYYDLMEEVFVTIYADFIVNNRYNEFISDGVRETVEAVNALANETIFDIRGREQLKYSDLSLNALVLFNADIRTYLSQNNDTSIELDYSKTKRYRQVAELISQDLANKKLIENCE